MYVRTVLLAGYRTTLQQIAEIGAPTAIYKTIPCMLLTIFIFLTLKVLGTQAYKKEDIDVVSSLLQGFGSPSPVNLECLAQHCTLQAGRCGLNAECRDSITCTEKCFAGWDADKTTEKYHVQNCTEICAFSYRGIKALRRFHGLHRGQQLYQLPSHP